jgi:hypothetical protein
MTVETKPKSVEGALYVAVHPNPTPQGGLPALRVSPECTHGNVSRPAPSWHIAQATLRLSAAKKVRIYTGGNTYRSQFVWVKPSIGCGRWNRNQHELLLVGTKGSPPARQTKSSSVR